MGAAKGKHGPLKAGEIGLVGICPGKSNGTWVQQGKHSPLKADEIGLVGIRPRTST